MLLNVPSWIWCALAVFEGLQVDVGDHDGGETLYVFPRVSRIRYLRFQVIRRSHVPGIVTLVITGWTCCPRGQVTNHRAHMQLIRRDNLAISDMAPSQGRMNTGAKRNGSLTISGYVNIPYLFHANE